MKHILSFGVIFFISLSSACFAEQTIVAKKVDQTPVIDGKADDAVWAKAKAITTHDEIADTDVTLKAVYTDDKISFLVIYPDSEESREHKTWVWNKETEFYDRDNDREDQFLFKWNMEDRPVDLSVYSDDEYTADMWFWKANRTDPVGFADDKHQILSKAETLKSNKMTSRSGKTMYLQRRGDSGTKAYKDALFVDYEGDRMKHFDIEIPSGSRADIRAKGIWSDGRWTIEFSRALNTEQTDDVQFNPKEVYLFGISRYEIAGTKPNPKLLQPLYGAGDVSESLILKFESMVVEQE